MSATHGQIDRLWTEFLRLTPQTRVAFIDRLVQDQDIRREIEDHLDLAVARVRATEPARPLRDILSDLDSRR